MVDRHQSSASCSCQPGLGLVRGKAHRPSATECPSWSHTTAFVAVVEESMPMTYVGELMLGHVPKAGGLTVRALLHVLGGGGDVLLFGYELAQLDRKHVVGDLDPCRQVGFRPHARLDRPLLNREMLGQPSGLLLLLDARVVEGGLPHGRGATSQERAACLDVA